MGHNLEVMNCWNALETAFLTSSTFTAELKEEVRRVLAFMNQCEYCMSKGVPSNSIESERTRKAVEFAKLWKNHLEISELAIASRMILIKVDLPTPMFPSTEIIRFA